MSHYGETCKSCHEFCDYDDPDGCTHPMIQCSECQHRICFKCNEWTTHDEYNEFMYEEYKDSGDMDEVYELVPYDDIYDGEYEDMLEEFKTFKNEYDYGPCCKGCLDDIKITKLEQQNIKLEQQNMKLKIMLFNQTLNKDILQTIYQYLK
jgi:hypothetical protein